jgi:hypothetical protein
MKVLYTTIEVSEPAPDTFDLESWLAQLLVAYWLTKEEPNSKEGDDSVYESTKNNNTPPAAA